MVRGKSCEYLALQMLIVHIFNYSSKLVDHKDFFFPSTHWVAFSWKLNIKQSFANENRPSENACDVFVDEVENEDELLSKENPILQI